MLRLARVVTGHEIADEPSRKGHLATHQHVLHAEQLGTLSLVVKGNPTSPTVHAFIWQRVVLAIVLDRLTAFLCLQVVIKQCCMVPIWVLPLMPQRWRVLHPHDLQLR